MRSIIDHLRPAAFTATRRVGLDVRVLRKTPDLIEFLAHRRVDVVYDVGANVGQFGLWLRRRGYRGRIVSFEPVQAAFEQLKMVAAADSAWTARHLAIGAEAGVAAINVSRNSQLSSFKEVADETPDPDLAIVRSERVNIDTLDLVSLEERSATFLKIDTQGFEQPVLDGAREFLAKTTGVMLELPVIHVYKRTWSISEALDYMHERGFVLCQAEQNNHHPDDPMATFEFDCVFRRIAHTIGD